MKELEITFDPAILHLSISGVLKELNENILSEYVTPSPKFISISIKAKDEVIQQLLSYCRGQFRYSEILLHIDELTEERIIHCLERQRVIAYKSVSFMNQRIDMVLNGSLRSPSYILPQKELQKSTILPASRTDLDSALTLTDGELL